AVSVGVDSFFCAEQGRAGAAESPGINVPAIVEHRRVMRTPCHHEIAVRTHGDDWIGANVGSGIHEEFAGSGRTVGVIKPRINIDAWFGSHAVGIKIIEIYPTHSATLFLLGDPGNDEAPARQRRKGRRALIEAGELVDKKFASDLLARG